MTLKAFKLQVKDCHFRESRKIKIVKYGSKVSAVGLKFKNYGAAVF
jgi:hypothetical protein